MRDRAFTICVPVWNGGRFIRGILESALSQSHPAWRLIVGDNASTDDLASVVRAYPDPRIRYHRWERHVGANENFNRTMALAESDWIIPIGADDRLHPDALERMSAALGAEDDEVSMVVAECCRTLLDGSSAEGLYYGSLVPVSAEAGRYDARRWLAVAATGGPFRWNIGSVAFARHALIESGAFRPDIGLAGDMELIFRLGAAKTVIYLDEPVMDFAVHPESDGNVQWASNRRNPRAAVPLATALLAILDAHEHARTVDEGERVAIRRAAARAYLQRAAQHRTLDGGLGRMGAARDVARAFRLGGLALFEPRSLAISIGSVVAPSLLLRRASAAMRRRQHLA